MGTPFYPLRLRRGAPAGTKNPHCAPFAAAPRPRDAVQGPGDNARMPLTRLAWLVTVAACVVTALLLFLSGYVGYGLVAVAVGLSAAINLR